MLNQIVLVGRVVKKPELYNNDTNNKTLSYLTLAVPRSFKNMNGEYDTDFIECILWDAVAKNTREYCNKGDIVGIRGRLQSRVVEEDDKKKSVLEVIAEKVTFLSSKNN